MMCSDCVDEWSGLTHLRFHTMVQICGHLWIMCCSFPEFSIFVMHERASGLPLGWDRSPFEDEDCDGLGVI